MPKRKPTQNELTERYRKLMNEITEETTKCLILHETEKQIEIVEAMEEQKDRLIEELKIDIKQGLIA